MRYSRIPGNKLKHCLCIITVFLLVLGIVSTPVAAVSQYVQVSVSPSSVIHGNSFTASINGISVHQYTISITGPGTTPQIAPGQVGVSGGGTTATVTTDVNGRRSVAFTTTRDTSKQQFKVTVTNTQDTSDYDSDTVWVTEGSVSISVTAQPETIPPTPSPTPLPTTVLPTTPVATPVIPEETEQTPGFMAPLAILAVAILGTAIILKRK